MMEQLSCHSERRRCQRIPLIVSLVISNLSSRFPFSEYTKTRQVGRYGCQVRTARPLTVGTQVRLDVLGDDTSRTTTARVIHSEPVRLHNDIKLWNSGLALDTPGNIWWGASPSEDRSAGLRQQGTRGGASSENQPAKPLHPLDRAVIYPMPFPSTAEPRRHHAANLSRSAHPARSWMRPLRGDGPPLRLLRVSAGYATNPDDDAGPRRLAAAPETAGSQPRPNSMTDQLEGEWEQAATALKGHLVGLESRLEQVTAELDAGFPARVQRVVADAVGRLREQLEHRLNDLIRDAMVADAQQGLVGPQPAREDAGHIGRTDRAHCGESVAGCQDHGELAGSSPHAPTCQSGPRGQ